MQSEHRTVLDVLVEEEPAIIESWLGEAKADPSTRPAMQVEAGAIIRGLKEALDAGGDAERFDGPAWESVRGTLADLSRSRAARGQSAGDTSAFVLALKKPMFASVQKRLAQRPQELVPAIWALSNTVDKLAQHTASVYQLAREDVIRRQQEELLELSTPVVKLWEGVLAVPMIGVLDSGRTQMVMEALLQRIVESGSALAIIDITGVPTVDTLVAQHLLKTVSAIRLMGADCIISGIRPQIAQTIVHLGIDLQGVSTKATLADALALALKQNGWRVTRDQDA
ncbi:MULTISPECIES: STAS domain-containing protein [unclassified Variovorax]|uniref:STAS domain-containing protein n=1 Tax=unclassified Variovorax TaxID=663243 RepID=UPI00076D355C|nr:MULTISPECIES: STAS domain-containing protein [unclassified Variovorax]KWT72182.1 RsbR, positive regulator of sigma-B [Variovorax sp. WDL1]PNG58878.1 RsbT co-antagonist protein RsbRA [Variovorax sp. B4]PNG61332.1 RsbT co-antagonist protein RsbRA [Variovorax sp. B2]VTV12673.1 Stressosome protein RsbRA [Variovorax sp. WDL1]